MSRGRMNPRRVRLLALSLPILVAAAALIAWSQPWVTVTIADGRVITAGGNIAAPAVPPLAFAALALVGALALAGRVFRVVLGLLQALLGLGVAASGLLALSDPVQAARGALTEATGVEGIASLRELAVQAVVSPWPAVAIAAGAAGVVVGVGIVLTASRWPQRSRRYEQVRLASAGDEAPAGGDASDRLDTWDALSDGDDPTAR